MVLNSAWSGELGYASPVKIDAHKSCHLNSETRCNTGQFNFITVKRSSEKIIMFASHCLLQGDATGGEFSGDHMLE